MSIKDALSGIHEPTHLLRSHVHHEKLGPLVISFSSKLMNWERVLS